MKKNQRNKLKTFFLCVLSLFILGCPDPNNADSTITVTSVTLDTATAEIEVEQTVQLTASVSPEDATNQTVTWSSSDEDVATVSDGLVTAVATGSAIITVTTEDGAKTATCDVTVAEATISVESVSLDTADCTMFTNDTKQLTATVSPEEATNQTVTWSSTDEDVATVSDSGLVTAVAVGSATITVTTEDGAKTAICDVTVSEPVENVTLDTAKYTLFIAGTKQLTATVSPEDATNKSVTWTSSDETVATVSDGLVTAVAAGNATITVTTEDGAKTATCEITVTTDNFAINFTGAADEEIDLSSDDSYILSKADWDSITVSVDDIWESYTWYVDGVETWSSDTSLTIYSDYDEYDIGYHTISVVVTKTDDETSDVAMYSKSLKIQITK
jgi:uncharacterized protein YjdB